MKKSAVCQEDTSTVFDCLSPKAGAVLAAVIADLLADGLDTVQIAVVATFITSIGDSLGYIAAQTELNEQILTKQREKGAADTPQIKERPMYITQRLRSHT